MQVSRRGRNEENVKQDRIEGETSPGWAIFCHLHREAFTSITMGPSKPKIPTTSVVMPKIAWTDFIVTSKLCPNVRDGWTAG
jgi:hypothetical protein